MRSNPLVSVVIPFFNTEQFLQEAIDSVLAQTYDNWELLLVDDGSTDTSTEIALRYAEQHPGQVRYLAHEDHQNRGASASRNLGSNNAQGEYIAFLDADDIWLPHKLEQQVAILESQPGVALVYGPGLWWYSWAENPEERQGDYMQDFGFQPDTLIKPPELLTLFLRNEAVVPPSLAIMVRREVLERAGGSEDACRSIYDDQVVLAKIGLEVPVYIAGECWYWYRQHPNQRCYVTHQTGQYHAVRLDFLNWLQGYLSEQGVKDREVWLVLQIEFALSYWTCGDLRQGAKYLNEALQYGPLGSKDIVYLFEKIVYYALAPEIKEPLQFALHLFELVHPTPQIHRLRRKVLGQISVDLAFRYYQVGELSQVWRHALGAIIHNPLWLRNRGLARIALEGLVGPRLFDLVR
jgi:glycosyltransferase involved in cell wall biosynthesis